MKRLWTILIVLLSLSVCEPIFAQLQWKEVTRKIVGRSLVDPGYSDGVEIFGKDGVITIRTQRRIQVRVFTILGQLVSQATLNPGVSELKIGSRGIYIVKTEHVTQKVAL